MTVLIAAQEVLKELGVTEPSEIDVDAIAWSLGARVKYRPLDGCEARNRRQWRSGHNHRQQPEFAAAQEVFGRPRTRPLEIRPGPDFRLPFR